MRPWVPCRSQQKHTEREVQAAAETTVRTKNSARRAGGKEARIISQPLLLLSQSGNRSHDEKKVVRILVVSRTALK